MEIILHIVNLVAVLPLSGMFIEDSIFYKHPHILKIDTKQMLSKGSILQQQLTKTQLFNAPVAENGRIERVIIFLHNSLVAEAFHHACQIASINLFKLLPVALGDIRSLRLFIRISWFIFVIRRNHNLLRRQCDMLFDDALFIFRVDLPHGLHALGRGRNRIG